MTKITHWIKSHQITSFFIITFGLVYLLAIPGIFLTVEETPIKMLIQFVLVRVLLFSPALAGIVVTYIISDKRKESALKQQILWFSIILIAGCFVSWFYQMITNQNPVQLSVFIPTAILGAMFPAFIISRAFSNVEGVRAYLGSIIKPHGKIIWYLVALFSFPLIHLFGNLITGITSREALPSLGGFDINLFSVACITFFSVFLFTGGINEESGWRGFAIPRLQNKYNPLIACLVVWFFHMLWELPGDIIFSGSPWPVMSRLVWMPSWSILFVWVYNRTNGSILAPVLFHASMNAMNPLMGVLPPTSIGTGLLVVLALYAIIYDKMWNKLPDTHPAVHNLNKL
ncbi:CPBP family intramembrane glutamic endopeptidase [Candidatus Neomarinimicrobiota bacterium]